MNYKMPRPQLVPRLLGMGRRHAAYRPALHPETQRIVREYLTAISARVWRERPWRIANQRQRLYACHWAGWHPGRTSERWGSIGRTWLLSHSAPIKHTNICDFMRRWWIRAPDATVDATSPKQTR